jgi:hypothetical protein
MAKCAAPQIELEAAIFVTSTAETVCVLARDMLDKAGTVDSKTVNI